MASKRARPALLWPSSQAVHSRRHASQVSPEAKVSPVSPETSGVSPEPEVSPVSPDEFAVSLDPEASQVPPRKAHKKKPHIKVDDTTTSVRSASPRKTDNKMGSDDLNKRYGVNAAEDFSNGVSKYQVLFNEFGLWFSDKDGQPLVSRRNVL